MSSVVEDLYFAHWANVFNTDAIMLFIFIYGSIKCDKNHTVSINFINNKY